MDNVFFPDLGKECVVIKLFIKYGILARTDIYSLGSGNLEAAV